MFKRLLAIFTFFVIVDVYGQEQKITFFPLAQVRLLDGQFKDAQKADLEYLLSLDADRLLAPYLKEAGLQPKAPNYGNWENTGLDGHIGGHYLSALAMMSASTGDPKIKEKFEYMLGELQRCQDKSGDGYLCGVPGGRNIWNEITGGTIKASTFNLNGKWVPLYNIHKIFSGLYDAWTIAGSTKAGEMLIKLSDWFMGVCGNLSEEQIQKMLISEHGGINEVYANLAEATGKKKYLDFARRLSHRELLNPLMQHKDELNGLHANTQIPKVIGFQRTGQLSGDTSWVSASRFFWNTVVKNRSVSIGGNSVREHFNPRDDFSLVMDSREGPETCNSYNMLKLTKNLFSLEPLTDYMDYYERTLYNHILSSQHPSGGFVYFTPMRPGHYRVYSTAQKSFWCCVGSGLENHAKYGEAIYAYQNNDIYVNLFIPSVLSWKEKGIELKQETQFPDKEESNLLLKLEKPKKFTLYLRYPAWAKKGKMRIEVNGKVVNIPYYDHQYIAIYRKWKTGDRIKLILPMYTKAETLPDSSSWVSFTYGPIVLAAKLTGNDLTGLRADDARMGHIAWGKLTPMHHIPLMVGEVATMGSALQKNAYSDSLSFIAPSIVHQQKYKGIQLIPFSDIHDSRYVIYFPYSTAAELPKKEKQLTKWEEESQKREAETVDIISCGEQQPESDHAFSGETTQVGIFKERRYRKAKGWFSYILKNKGGEGKKVRVMLYGNEKGKNFDILVNNMLIGTVRLVEDLGDRFYEKEFILPEEVTNKRELLIKFITHKDSETAGVYEIRLVR